MTKCRFRECEREARKGYTMCPRHFSAGTSTKQQKMMQQRQKRRVS